MTSHRRYYAMALKIVRREIVLLTETAEGNSARTDIHEMDRITNALAQVQNATIAVAFYDSETGHLLRKVELGEGTPEFRRMVELEFSPDDVVA